MAIDVGASSGESDLSDDEVVSGFATGFTISGKRIFADLIYAKALQRPASFSSGKEQFYFSVTFRF
jgi:hemolysin activation/secretion protein